MVQTKLWVTGGILTIIILALLSLFLWIRYGKAKKDSSLLRMFFMTEKVKETVRQSQEKDDEVLANDITNPSQAKERIRKELESVVGSKPLDLLSKEVRESQNYRELKAKAENKLAIGDSVSWLQIEDLVKGISTDFDTYLDILTENKISKAERRVAYLIKLGFSNTQIADLLNRLPGTVSNQRSSIAKKIGCEKSAVDSMLMRL